MNNGRRIYRVPAILMLIAAACGLSFAQKITQYGGSAALLAGRWKWAAEEAGRQGIEKGYWVGYSIERQMGEHSFIGRFYSDQRRNRPTLAEMVTGMRAEELPASAGGSHTSSQGMMSFNDDDKPEKMVTKEVGFLFHIGKSTGRRGSGKHAVGCTTAPGEIGELDVSNLSLHVDLDSDPLLWLGGAGYEESVAFLEDLYGRTNSTDAKKEFLMAIGLHRESKRAIDILKKILLSSADPGLREDAAFWLGQTNTDEAGKVLNEVAWNDASEDVREKAIFSLSQMDGETSVDAIIALARGHKNRDTREKAAFWLGQKASKKAVGTLKEMAYKDEDTQVQRSAMFALTQMENGGGVDELIHIARTHPNPKIRKDAIFWLGQSEDPKALDVLISIVKER